MDCEYRPRLNALHDAETGDAEARDLARHIEGCVACAAELEEMRQVSAEFDRFATEGPSQSLLRQLHRAADDAAKAGADASADVGAMVVRVAGFLTALAASVMLVSWAWFGQPPAPTAIVPAPVTLAPAPAPEWERVAMTLDAGPLPAQAPDGPGRFVLAAATDGDRDARLADWMLVNLNR